MSKKRIRIRIRLGDCPTDASPLASLSELPEDLDASEEVLAAQDVAEDAQFVLELAQDATEEALA